jgi:hypothetical protein
LSLTEPHNEFLELCAVSTSGQLTEEEQKKLQEHLAVCQSCRDALKEYETVVGQAIPKIAASQEHGSAEPGPAWSQERAEKAFFKRLAQEEDLQPEEFSFANGFSTDPRRLPPFSTPVSNGAIWSQVWTLYAAGILLFASLGFYAYRVGLHPRLDIAKHAPAAATSQDQASLEEQLSDAGHDREVARTQVVQRDKTVADLRQQLAQQMAEINGLKTAQGRLENDLRVGDATRQDLAQQRTELAQKLDAAQSSSLLLQQKLDSLAQQSAQDATRAKTLEAKVSDLNRLLQDRETALDQKDELLAHDRDIRELMGARDLYVAEVYDVARTGETQKAYGRVFYTRGRSLIFYAYDLDRQADLKQASSFQAWGQRGPDRKHAVNLGVFYEDSASKKRWVMKCDDPKTLAQIDAVFVTVEPDGRSQKPSGKSLLFAYLKVDPNHP